MSPSAWDRLSQEQRIIIENIAASSAMDGHVVSEEEKEIAARRMLGEITGDEAVQLAADLVLQDRIGGELEARIESVRAAYSALPAEERAEYEQETAAWEAIETEWPDE